jgi:ssDNA-binding Zn-finger/Zn-ribbon topoisomerase 1
MRDDGEPADTMDMWDQAKLQEVVEKKHGDTNKTKPQTDIICKFFLDAVEKSKYGWFWECPNGENCHYRHALPAGFVLKKDKIKDAKKDEISLEDLIERERNALGSNLTKITLETFTQWKKRKILERKAAMQKDEDKKRAEFKAGRQVGLSGREMFTFNPSMAADSDQLEDGDDTFDTRNLPDEDGEDEDNQEYKEISFDQLEGDAREVDDSGTVAASDRLNQLKISSPESETGGTGDGKGNNVDVPIDENLFEDSDLPDSDDDDDDSQDS